MSKLRCLLLYNSECQSKYLSNNLMFDPENILKSRLELKIKLNYGIENP